MNEQSSQSEPDQKKASWFSFSNILIAVLVIYIVANTVYRLTGNG